MLNLGIFVFGLVASGTVAIFTAITLRELRRLGVESDQRQAMAPGQEGILSSVDTSGVEATAPAVAAAS